MLISNLVYSVQSAHYCVFLSLLPPSFAFVLPRGAVKGRLTPVACKMGIICLIEHATNHAGGPGSHLATVRTVAELCL